MARTEFGDISPRTAGYAARQLLERGMPHLQIEKFGQVKPVPEGEGKSIKFRRYEAFSRTPNELQEGVTPVARKLTSTDVEVSLKQYGDLVEITDVIEDTHEDPVLNEAVEILGEQAPQMLETVRFHTLRAGTNVFYSNGSSRSSVNTSLSKSDQQRVVRALKRQNARKITRAVRSTPSFNTENIRAAFIALTHPDTQSTIEGFTGFKSPEDYGNHQPMEGEIGAVGDVRYLESTIIEPWEGAGSGTVNSMIATGGNVDVYPTIYLAQNAFGVVPFKGRNAVTPSVINPGTRDKSDPLGQRGFAGWKSWHAAVILNDNWMARVEHGNPSSP